MVWCGKANLQEGGQRVRDNDETVFDRNRKEQHRMEGGKREKDKGLVMKKSSLKLENISSSAGLNLPLLLKPEEKATVELS